MTDKMFDVVDLYMKLEDEFPNIDFITEDEQVNRKTVHRFKIRSLNKIEFNPPVKTSILISKNGEISEDECDEIVLKIRESFKLNKLV